MANLQAIKPDPVYLDLGGKHRRLKFDMNAFGLMEKHYGSIDTAMTALQKGTILGSKYILWAGLVHEEIATRDEETGEPLTYSITPYDVGSWIDPMDFGPVMRKLTVALTGAQPTVVKSQEIPTDSKIDDVEAALLAKEATGVTAEKQPSADVKN